jgi:hypothetical protein
MLIPLRCPMSCLEGTEAPSQRKRPLLSAALLWTALALFATHLVRAEENPDFKTKDVILVHGAWADGFAAQLRLNAGFLSITPAGINADFAQVHDFA